MIGRIASQIGEGGEGGVTGEGGVKGGGGGGGELNNNRRGDEGGEGAGGGSHLPARMGKTRRARTSRRMQNAHWVRNAVLVPATIPDVLPLSPRLLLLQQPMISNKG